MMLIKTKAFINTQTLKEIINGMTYKEILFNHFKVSQFIIISIYYIKHTCQDKYLNMLNKNY